VLTVSACGVVPNPLETPVPPDALHPNVPAPVEPPMAVPADPAKIGELERHRALWDQLGVGDYTMTVIYGCECALAGRPVTVTVANRQLVGAVVGGKALDLGALTGFPATVDALFDYAARFSNAGKIEFKWDERSGIPIAVGVDPDLRALDDEIRIAITDFRPIR
jgi:hypothetical protein